MGGGTRLGFYKVNYINDNCKQLPVQPEFNFYG